MPLSSASLFVSRIFLLVVAPIAFSLSSSAQTVAKSNPPLASPVGRWKTVDDATGKVKSIVDIREENGKLYGTIEELFDPPVPHPTCYLCTGDLKDRPLVGLQILSGFVQDGDHQNGGDQNGGEWSGGQVLDPETGKIYRASIALEDGGKKLRLHGYFLVTLLGRTEHWLRAE
jgi:uncharacterized protein (DUF2147 family)